MPESIWTETEAAILRGKPYNHPPADTGTISREAHEARHRARVDLIRSHLTRVAEDLAGRLAGVRADIAQQIIDEHMQRILWAIASGKRPDQPGGGPQ